MKKLAAILAVAVAVAVPGSASARDADAVWDAYWGYFADGWREQPVYSVIAFPCVVITLPFFLGKVGLAWLNEKDDAESDAESEG